jgi:hypothetical protein
MCDKRLRVSACFGHPRGQQRQRAIGLPDNEVVGAGVALHADNGDNFVAARMKPVADSNLSRQTPGSMTLLRLAQARAISP